MTTDELLARLVNLDNEAVQARQRQGSAEHALAAAQQRIQQQSSRGGASGASTGVIDTRTLGKPKSFTGQAAEWTTWQFMFKAFGCAAHPRVTEVFDLATRKGPDPVVNNDMSAELQSRQSGGSGQRKRCWTHDGKREREGEWGRNTLRQRFWRNAIAEVRTLSHLPSGSLSCMGLAAPTYGNLNHLCDWSEHGE